MKLKTLGTVTADHLNVDIDLILTV